MIHCRDSGNCIKNRIKKGYDCEEVTDMAADFSPKRPQENCRMVQGSREHP